LYLRQLPAALIPLSSIVSRSLPARLDRYPRGFTGHIADPISSIVLIRGNEETFDRLGLNESVHNLCDVGDRDAPVKKMIGFD
jgi:hypothetical protein